MRERPLVFPAEPLLGRTTEDDGDERADAEADGRFDARTSARGAVMYKSQWSPFIFPTVYAEPLSACAISMPLQRHERRRTKDGVEELDLLGPGLVRSELAFGEHERLSAVEAPPDARQAALLGGDGEERPEAEQERRRAARLEDELVRPDEHGALAASGCHEASVEDGKEGRTDERR